MVNAAEKKKYEISVRFPGYINPLTANYWKKKE
jgi:hypothetical protein